VVSAKTSDERQSGHHVQLEAAVGIDVLAPQRRERPEIGCGQSALPIRLGEEATMKLFEQRASKTLAALRIEMSHACEKRNPDEACAIDWD
jgi:hypothetical protein